MINNRVFVTGITGFLGSAIAEVFVKNNYEVIGLKRKNSDPWRCKDFLTKVTLTNVEDEWKQDVLLFKPSLIIHAAWGGVSAKDRDNWLDQSKNLPLTIELLQLANELKVEKFIGLGSQAEYGLFNGVVTEDQPVHPNSAYGLNKLLAMQTIKCFAEQNSLNWYWLRLFSFFGEKEDANWFIPTIIDKLRTDIPMDMTPGDQRYAYMYIDDLANLIFNIAIKEVNSGVYNVSSNNHYSLKQIVHKILRILNKQENLVNFGAIPYRTNQPMLVAGDNARITTQIGNIAEVNFDNSLEKIIRYRESK